MDADLSMPDARLRRMPPLCFGRRSIARCPDTTELHHQARAGGNGHQSGRHRHTSPSSAPLASSSQRHISMAADPESPGRLESAAALASIRPRSLSIPGLGHLAMCVTHRCNRGGQAASGRADRSRARRARTARAPSRPESWSKHPRQSSPVQSAEKPNSRPTESVAWALASSSSKVWQPS